MLQIDESPPTLVAFVGILSSVLKNMLLELQFPLELFMAFRTLVTLDNHVRDFKVAIHIADIGEHLFAARFLAFYGVWLFLMTRFQVTLQMGIV